MSDIDEIELRRLDLTVLLVFLNLMRFGKATDVAAHMGLTQSSISHSIRRLRDSFGDPLFLRKPHGLEPTSVARILEPKIRLVVETLSQSMQQRDAFDPSNEEGTFRIGAYDNEMATLVPDLVGRIKTLAPRLRISAHTLGRRPALTALGNHEIDLALGFIWDMPKEFIAHELYEETYQVVFRNGHPDAADLGKLKNYCAAEHIVVSPSGDFSGIVDVHLEKLGRRRPVVASLPLFLPALALVSVSDLVATLPTRVVQCHAKRFGLTAVNPPFRIRPFSVSAIRHIREQKNPLHDWIVGLLKG